MLKVLYKYILIAFGIILISSIDIEAQEIKIKSFSLQMEPMTVPMQRIDANGNVCALVKVIIPNAQVSFEGNIIGECEYKIGEYWCYLSLGSKYLRVKQPDYEPLMVNFEYTLETKQIYELVLTLPQSNISDSILSKNRMETLMRNLTQSKAVNLSFRRGKLFPCYIRENGSEKVGFLNRDLKVVFITNYTNLMNAFFIDDDKDYSVDIDYHWVKDSIGNWGVINSNGREIVQPHYKKIYEPKEDLSRAQIVLAEDVDGQSYVLNRLTGEIINLISKWDDVRDGYYLKQPTRLLKYTDRCNHKDCFIDKITGKRRVVKIPNGYLFKEFLAFNHLRVRNNKENAEKILNSEGDIITEDYFHPLIYGERAIQYLFGRYGIYDLAKENYVYYGGRSSTNYRALSDDIIAVSDYNNTRYFDIESLNFIHPDFALKKIEENSSKRLSMESVKSKLRCFFKNPFIIIPIEEGIYCAKSADEYFLVNKYGTIIDENLKTYTIQHWKN